MLLLTAYSLYLKIITHLEFEICLTKKYYFDSTSIKNKSIWSLFKKTRQYPNLSDKRQDNIQILLTKDKEYFYIFTLYIGLRVRS